MSLCDNLETPLRCIAEHCPPVGEDIYPGFGSLLRNRRVGARCVDIDVAPFVLGTDDIDPVLGDGARGGIV
jgi:hypothetical protein